MTLKVLFVHPHFSFEMPEFLRGLTDVGAEVHGISESPLEALPENVRSRLASHHVVSSLLDEDRLFAEALPIARALGPDLIETQFEYSLLGTARLRKALGLPGMTENVLLGFRDKGVMRERAAAAGLPVPQTIRIHDEAEAHAAARAIGYPVIVKPIDGAGCAGVRRVESDAELTEALRAIDVTKGQIEQFIDGEELTYDALYLDGRPVFESISRYYPRPLESRSNEQVGLSLVTARDPEEHADGVRLGRGVHAALGMKSGFTHMEWYRTSTGKVYFGEIAARASGGHLVELMNRANDIDLYREWARIMCRGAYAGQPSRAHYGGLVFKRAKGQGIIRRIEGLESFERDHPGAIVASWLSPIGTPRRDWRSSHFADGVVLVRDPDHDACRRLVQRAERDVTSYAD